MEPISETEPASISEGKTSGTAYDTAWTARITDGRGTPLFPECVKWLLENQKEDGSWGGQILNYHDRIISTLSALLALKEIDKKNYSRYIQKGEAFVWENLKNVDTDRCRLIGSELLIPSLMSEAESLGLNLPFHITVYEREYWLKLAKIEESWYSPLTTLSFSLEFLGDNVDRTCLLDVQLPHGSVATSPAATAFFFRHTRDVRAYAYLKEVLSLTGDGSVMAVYPINVFEYGWTLYNLMLAGLYLYEYTGVCDFLFNHLTPTGTGPSTESPLTDADDTAVVYKILYDMGYPVDIHIFDAYAADDYYLTFPFELNPSVSTNIHVLTFINSCSEFPDRDDAIENQIQFLRKSMYSPGFWLDKWHVSPYYPTSHAIFALWDTDPFLAEKGVSWILDTQNENGTWGLNTGTIEETACAVQALMYYHQNIEHIDIPHSLNTLDINHVHSPSTLCELWIGKTLYTPLNVVFSSMVSASIMYNTCVWKRCSGWSV
jgi:halimadienyl-diphosphate synthase